MEKFGLKYRVLMGVTLFSMFFGAGNLIFPPFLGAQAGTRTAAAFLGFAASAVCLPVLGVVAVTRCGGLEKLTGRVGRHFAFFYILILYLAIGPCLAIPRTASTSFSMALPPFFDLVGHLWIARLIYSLVFFTAAGWVALHPDRLTDYLGKRLTPILLTLILVIFCAALIHPAGNAAAPAAAYEGQATVQGFLDGYQTMDTLAALNFGMIVAVNIRAKKITREKAVVRETIYAGWIAGIFLLVIYSMLAFVGMVSGERFADAANGTETLTSMVSFLFGPVGAVILAAVFVIACFNTCVGLLSCCGKYFQSVFPKLSYKMWVFVFAAVSMVISNVGLDAILVFSVPVLNAIYPVAIVLIVLSFARGLHERYPALYPWTVALCGAASVIAALDGERIVIPALTGLIRYLPAYAAGFGWLVPAAVGAVIGRFWPSKKEGVRK